MVNTLEGQINLGVSHLAPHMTLSYTSHISTPKNIFFCKNYEEPWLGSSLDWRAILYTKRLWVRFYQGIYLQCGINLQLGHDGRQPTDVSHSQINKHIR